LRDSLPIDMLLSVLSFLVVAQSSSEVPEGLMNNPVFFSRVHFAQSVASRCVTFLAMDDSETLHITASTLARRGR